MKVAAACQHSWVLFLQWFVAQISPSLQGDANHYNKALMDLRMSAVEERCLRALTAQYYDCFISGVITVVA